MRICASLSSIADLEKADMADMVEIRLDLLGEIPEVKDKDLLVTYRGEIDLSILPPGYKGMIDIGEEDRPETDLGVVASYHDYESTPDAERIISILSAMDSDISKAAFAVNSFSDLVSIVDAARSFKKRHVILGMGALGTVTRIRQALLGNEFSFGYVGEPTAPGQLSVDEMSELDDDCLLIGILGNPLSKSASPRMQNAALRASGINGMYLPFESENLEQVEEMIRGYDIRGVNVTIPHKQEIMDHVDAVDKAASAIGAVNTIVNENGRLEGRNTDVIGIETALDRAGFEAEDKRALILGSGGAAKACAYHLSRKDCDITITGRNRETGEEVAKDFGATYRAPSSVSPKMYDLVVNCTPVGMYSDGPYPINITALTHEQTVFDMVYGKETPLMSEARSKGCRLASGADMLAGQGAASFEMWTGVGNMFDIMRRELE
ncbi:MAG: shikimate dehydrogenase [Candidatus Methanomethylophilaceae archaeon]|nr:shikimate dehydrogenase [Candidatus Methanomethylophilaceae archaeon]